jgi:hypothetical protein
MRVVQKSPFIYKGCTLPEANHIFMQTRVITVANQDMSQEIIEKLDCNNVKKKKPECHDAVCDDVVKRKLSFGSTSLPGQCPTCKQLGLYEGE